MIWRCTPVAGARDVDGRGIAGTCLSDDVVEIELGATMERRIEFDLVKSKIARYFEGSA